MADAIAVLGIAPDELADDVPGVRIEQQLVRIETMAALRVVGPMDTVAIQQTRPCFGQVTVPDHVGMLAHVDALDFMLAGRIEDAQLDAFGMFGKQGEVDALAIPGCATRIGRTGPDGGNR